MASEYQLAASKGHKMPFRVLLLLGLALQLGCSGRPSEALISQQLNEAINEELGEGTARIENLKKTNGYEKPPNQYVVEVEFDLVFLKGLEQLSAEMAEQSSDQPFGKLGAGLSAMTLRMALGDFEAGTTKHIDREIALISTENGWRIFKE